MSLVLPPAENRAGDIVIADIGIPAGVVEAIDGPRVELMTRSSIRELIAPRSPDSHKGDYGHVLDRRRLPRKDGRGASDRRRRAAIGRRAGHGCDAGRAPRASSHRWRRST